MHVFTSFFLWLGLDVWRVFNSIMLAAIVFFGANTASGRNAGNESSNPHSSPYSSSFSSIIIVTFISTLGISLTRQSIFWLTGSFNYVYPMLILLIYWCTLSNEHKTGAPRVLIPILGFLSGASVEQAGVMAFGLTVMIFCERLIIYKRFDKTAFSCLFTSSAGCLTVLLAPANAYRAALEATHSLTFSELVSLNLRNIIRSLFFSDYMILLTSIALLCAIVSIIVLSRHAGNPILPRAVAALGIIVLTCYLLISNSNITRLMYILPLIIAYAGIMLYSGIIIYKAYKSRSPNSSVPMMSFILYIGGQVMMLISPVYGLRNLLCSIIMLSIFSASTLAIVRAELWDQFSNGLLSNMKLCRVFATVIISALTVLSLKGFYSTYIGYRANSVIFKENIARIETYKLNEETLLVLQKFPDDSYGWVMPYHNSYYDPYFKKYFGLKPDTEIHWVGTGYPSP